MTGGSGILERLEAELTAQRAQLSAALARIAALEARPRDDNAERRLTLAQAAAVARVGKARLAGAIHAGELVATVNPHRAGRSPKYLIAPRDLQAWLEARGRT